MRPMLATRGTQVPTGGEWIHEVKWDGIRLLADLDRERARFTSRNENDVTGGYPELAGLAGRDLLLDGEVVVLVDGRPSFGALAERMHTRDRRRLAAFARTRPATYLVFDLLRLDGRDLTREPLERRRQLLGELGLADRHWQVPDGYDDGAMLMRATLEQGLEGIISKRRSSRYEPGARSRNWLKFPHRLRRSVVVGGWRTEVDSDRRLGALLVGRPTAQGLLYLGRVGSGLAGRKAALVEELLASRARDENPFADEVPRVDAVGTRWVDPSLVVEIESLGLSSQGRLRQPAYVGVRSDVTPESLEES